MGGTSKFLFSLVLGAVAYVVAGYYLADLPPRGISLNRAQTSIRVEHEKAEIRTTLTYKCHSWRPRRASVYLPFGPGGSEVTDFEGIVPATSRYQLFPDGVLLELVMKPDSEATVEFRYHQPWKDGRFVYRFGVSKGWELPPNLVTYEFDLPATANYQFPAQRAVQRVASKKGRVEYTVDGQEGDVVVEWQ
jgi:hypothetical protein